MSEHFPFDKKTLTACSQQQTEHFINPLSSKNFLKMNLLIHEPTLKRKKKSLIIVVTAYTSSLSGIK